MFGAVGEERRGESGKSDQRTPFERDRDRVLYTSALRRLAGVTQVVRPAEGHIFHNRLTHTHEVAQIGRRLAQELKRKTPSEDLERAGGLEPEAVEAAALAHDLGHPPFGHIAEKELDQVIRDELDCVDGFEGNAQSFRIVTKLAVRTEKAYGLNLTRRTLAGALKYPWLRECDCEPLEEFEYGGTRTEKWGAYRTENEMLEWVTEHSDTDGRKSLEADVMDWADDIAYAVHDLEDFVRAGLVPLGRLISDDVERQRFKKAVFEGQEPSEFTEEDFDRFFKNARFAYDVQPYDGSVTARANLREFTSYLVGRYIVGPSGADDDQRVVRVNPEPEEGEGYLSIDSSAQADVAILKAMTWHYVISNRALVTQQRGQKKVIRSLFEIFHEATGSRSDYDVLPPAIADMLRALDESEDEEGDERIRLAADAVCSLTDQGAIKRYKRLTGIELGSVLDLV